MDELSRRLDTWPHERLKGRPEFKLRVGDYRVIYRVQADKIIVLKIGHRKEVYSKVFSRLSS